MIRRATAIWFSLAGLLACGMYLLKHEVQTLEKEAAALDRAILDNQEAMHVLKAEWSYLNDPARLRELVARHLELKPMSPGQLALTLAALPMREGDPAPNAFPPGTAIDLPPLPRMKPERPHFAPRPPGAGSEVASTVR